MNEPWKKTLRPFATDWEKLEAKWGRQVRGLTDRALMQLYQSSTFPTESNCGYGTYEAAKILKDICYQETRLRERARIGKETP